MKKQNPNEVDVRMPDESCRRCGGTLKDCASCSQCSQGIKKMCAVCGTMTEEQFHAGCLYASKLPISFFCMVI